MKVGIYSPYLDSFGGGERYVLTVAETLSQNHHVDVLLDEHLLSLKVDKRKDDFAKYFNIDLSKVFFIKSPIRKKGNFLEKFFFLRGYDLLFYLTDGSIFYSPAKRNIIHFQVPFKNSVAGNFWGKIKLSSWNMAVYNSRFTKDIVEKYWPIKGKVVYPPVNVDEIKPLQKKKYILSVGRFFGYLKTKKQEEMIQTFSKLYLSGKIIGWSLHLAGSASEGDRKYLAEIKKKANGLPVYFYPNIAHQDLLKLYGESSIYWHAAGYGEEDPEKMEHFGITTVEAMAAGAVPVVINKGGQREIVEDGINGFLWNSLEELEEKTVQVIQNKKLAEKISASAIKKSKEFSKAKFAENIQNIVKELF